jgi:predicted membrane protein
MGKEEKNMNSRNVFAVIMIVLGIGFFLNQFELWNFGFIIGRWWPVILVVIGLYKISTDKSSILFGLIVFMIGGLLLAGNLHVLPFGFWGAFWPLLLVMIGISLFAKRPRKHTPNLSQIDDIEEIAIMSGSEQIINSQNFSGGSATAVMGGIELNLRNAKLSPEGAFLDLTAIMGGIELRVPETWRLEITGTPLLGGLENQARLSFDREIEGTLRIKYTAIMGGIEIRN